MMIDRRDFIAGGAAVVAVAPVPLAGPVRSEQMAGTDALEAVIKQVIANHPIPDPGVAVGVIKDRQVFFTKGFGFADRAARSPVGSDTLFAIGSNTKAFTTLALGMLVDQQLVKLDTPVTQYLPDFAVQDRDAQAAMTLEDILSHRTGIPRHDALWYLTPLSSSQLFHRLRYLDPNTAPGKGFRKAFEYNNMTYLTAMYVLELTTGATWADFVTRKILAPLGMSSTNLSIGDFVARADRAKGYFKTTELPLKDFDNIGPSARINSNVTELIHWVLLHLNRGAAADGTRLIQPDTLDKLYDKRIDVGAGVGYGLGWFVTQVGGKKLIYHGGNADGYTCYVSFMPENGSGVIVLTNQHQSLLDRDPPLSDKIASAIYGQLATARSEELDAPHATARAATQVAPLASELADPDMIREFARLAAAMPQVFTGGVTDYTGMFTHPAYGDMSVTARGRTLRINYFANDWALAPIPIQVLIFSPDLFSVTFRAYGIDFTLPVMFNRNASGEVDKLSIPFERTVKQIQFMKR